MKRKTMEDKALKPVRQEKHAYTAEELAGAKAALFGPVNQPGVVFNAAQRAMIGQIAALQAQIDTKKTQADSDQA